MRNPFKKNPKTNPIRSHPFIPDEMLGQPRLDEQPIPDWMMTKYADKLYTCMACGAIVAVKMQKTHAEYHTLLASLIHVVRLLSAKIDPGLITRIKSSVDYEEM